MQADFLNQSYEELMCAVHHVEVIHPQPGRVSGGDCHRSTARVGPPKLGFIGDGIEKQKVPYVLAGTEKEPQMVDIMGALAAATQAIKLARDLRGIDKAVDAAEYKKQKRAKNIASGGS
jgi:hypothetical protein